jgi:hypothetical protein
MVADPEMGDGEMPAETIYSGRNPVDVRVAWGPDEFGEVQIATLLHSRSVDDGPMVTPIDHLFKMINEWLDAAKMPLIDVEELKRKSPHAPHFDGYHATLDDWASVNKLIRVLQRARDKQFGVPA